MQRRQWLLIIVLVALWFGVTRYNSRRLEQLGSGLSGPNLSQPGVTRKMATGWTLLGADGKAFDWSKVGGRLILVNIWATWCPPCRAELPSLASLAANERLKDKLVVLCVSTDDKPEALKSFLDRQKLDLPAFFAPELPSDYVTEGIPATFLLDSDGTLIGSEVGAARWDDPAFVQKLASIPKK